METANKLIEYQKTHEFADVVIEFMDQVTDEQELPTKEYAALWIFLDGSKVLLREETFIPVGVI